VGLVGLLERVVPNKRESVLFHSFPDWDDQVTTFAEALIEVGLVRQVWIVNGEADSSRAAACLRSLQNHGAAVRVLPVRSFRALAEYCRATIVVHTHGVYQQPRRSRSKTFVNLWHGMPVKRLVTGSAIGQLQSDLVPVTSAIHAKNMAAAWGGDARRFVSTGLPRNDVLLNDNQVASRPYVLWLPTYRVSVRGELRRDGVEAGELNFAGMTLADAEAMARRLGRQLVVKAHPMAPPLPAHSSEWLRVVDESDLASSGRSLYELMSGASALITDHSSVWVDFLLTQRPIIFAISDLAEYSETRGHYFEPLEAHLPGPMATDGVELEGCLRELLGPRDPWGERRLAALRVHHAHADGNAARRLARLLSQRL
jgi:CDP-glycerol glycerophosphotransferase